MLPIATVIQQGYYIIIHFYYLIIIIIIIIDFHPQFDTLSSSVMG